MTQISRAHAPDHPPAPPTKPPKRQLALGAKGGSENSNMATVSGSNIPTIVTVLIANIYINVTTVMKHRTGKLHAPTSNSPMGPVHYFNYTTNQQ